MSNGGENNIKENPADLEQNNGSGQNDCEEVKATGTETPGQDEEIIRLNKEIETLKDLLQRRQADFENFRKRTVKLQEDYKKLAIKDFAYDILNVNDDLSRAIEASESISENDSGSRESFIEGFKLVSRRIVDILGKYGIEEIDSENKPFNPGLHEALEIEQSGEHAEDTVTRVYQKGYRIDEHIVRTAKVKVSKPAPKRSEGTDGE